MPDIPGSLEGLSPTEKRMLLAQMLQRKMDRSRTFPMSHGQRGLWLLHQLRPGTPVYNIPFASQVRSELDIPALRQTLEVLVQRHASLRTTFAEHDGKLVQQVQPTMPIDFKQIDARGWSDDRLQQHVENAVAAPFDLAVGSVLRFRLFTRSRDHHVLASVAHHIAVDFWSLVVMLMDVRRIYPSVAAGHDPALPAIKNSYADYVHWQRDMLASEDGEQLAAYWQQQLAGVPHVLELPADKQRPAEFTHRASVVPCEFDKELTARLNQLASQQGVTIYSLLLAAYQFLLSRHTGQTDFLIGTPFVGRSRPGFEETVGYFVNLLPIRARIDDNQTFRQLVQQVSTTALEALQHQDYPFPLIAEHLAPARDPSRPPLVQASFTLERAHRHEEAGRGRFLFPNATAQVEVAGLQSETYYVEQKTCGHELELVLEQSEGRIQGLLCYCEDLFSESLMKQLVGHLRTILYSAADDLDQPLAQLAWYANDEQDCVVNRWNATEVATPAEDTLLDLFLRQARETPTASALRFAEQDYSYAQLDAWTNQLAKNMAARGLAPGQMVALCVDRSPACIALILATWKAGGVCVPLDAETPSERMRTILADTQAALVVAQSNNIDSLREMVDSLVVTTEELSDKAASDWTPSLAACQTDEPAYVIYTSGSTGQPKGVVVEHGAICNTICWRNKTLPLTQDDRVLLMLPCFFDASFAITFWTLTQGACLVIVPPGEERNPTALLDLTREQLVTVLPASPRLLQVLVNHPTFAACTRLRHIQTGGEELPVELCRQIVNERNLPLANMYGPTEAAVETTAWFCRPGDQPTYAPIGRPISNVQTFILNAHGQPLPPGIAGELFIAGRGLARGYLNAPELTAERFVEVSLPGRATQRMYRTGDLCRWRHDGNIEFLGRIDQQVKLRGYRIELAEVEHAITASESVDDAAVMVHANASQQSQLVAYVVPHLNGESWSEETLRRELRHRLPHYMLPSYIEPMNALPRTASGKLDRQALPAPQWRAAVGRPYVAPQTKLEQFLVEACQKILCVERIGMRDSFYELGGTSIQGATLLAQLQDELDVRIQTSALFDLTEIGDVANYVCKHYQEAVANRFGQEAVPRVSSAPAASSAAGADTGQQKGLVVPLQPTGTRLPLFMVHPPGGIVICYQPLARYLGNDQPLYGIRARGLHEGEALPQSLQAMAAEYVEAIRATQPHGPYQVGGWSLGGVVAYEIAQQLVDQGETVRSLVLLDTTIPEGEANEQFAREAESTGLEYGLDVTLEQLGELGPDQQLPYLFEHARKLGVIDEQAPESLVQQVLEDLKRLFHTHLSLSSQYAIKPYPGRVILLRPLDAPVPVTTTPDRGWSQLTTDLHVDFVPGLHHSMVKEPHVAELARTLRQQLESG